MMVYVCVCMCVCVNRVFFSALLVVSKKTHSSQKHISFFDIKNFLRFFTNF